MVEIIRKLILNPKFEAAVREKIDTSIDVSVFKADLDHLRKRIKQVNGAKAKLAQQMDTLDITDPQYDNKYADMQYRLDKFYMSLEDIERQISDTEFKIETIKEEKIKSDAVYQYLLCFDQVWNQMTEKEKKIFLNSFLKSVDIFEEERCDGRLIKAIGLRFPVFCEDGEVVGVSWDKENSVETVVLLVKLPPDDVIKVKLDVSELPVSIHDGDATYPEIQAYVEKQFGLKVSSLYISQVKRKYGLPVTDSYNKPKSEHSRQPQCPPEKEKAITDALKYFKMIE